MNHTILVVEDEEETRETFQEALQHHGYKVVAASDGLEALEKISKFGKPCMIFLDLIMPKMNGWDFFAATRTMPELATVPIIVLSSVPSGAPKGVTCVLKKPIEFKKLLSTAQEFCPRLQHR